MGFYGVPSTVFYAILRGNCAFFGVGTGTVFLGVALTVFFGVSMGFFGFGTVFFGVVFRVHKALALSYITLHQPPIRGLVWVLGSYCRKTKGPEPSPPIEPKPNLEKPPQNPKPEPSVRAPPRAQTKPRKVPWQTSTQRGTYDYK